MAKRVFEQVGGTVGRTFQSFGRAIDTTLLSVIKLSGMGRKPGAPAGIEHAELAAMPSTSDRVYISCIDYSPQQVLTRDIEPDQFDAFLAEHRPPWCTVRWINVDGLTNMHVIESLARKYDLHPLAVEDLLHVPQRPKVDSYGGDGHQPRLFIITQMLQWGDKGLEAEQISIFVGHSTVITFQVSHGDIWDPIRQRINKEGSRLRINDASFLVYALLDAVVDFCFPVLEKYGEQLEDIEERIVNNPTQDVIHEIHGVRRELLLIRRQIWPMREMLLELQREPHQCMSDNTRVYLRDIYDHAVQIIDFIETCREMAAGLADAYMSSLTIRTNEVIRVLTVMGTIFIPITFLASVYGMNFAHIPELQWYYGYPAFWAVCILTVGSLLIYFHRKKWL